MRTAPCIALLLALVACDSAGGPSAETAADSTVVARITRAPENGEVQIIRTVANGGVYAFEPARVTVEPGDVVRFVHTSHQPESIAFLRDGLGENAIAFLEDAGAMNAVLLTRPGQIYDMSFVDAPPGQYGFISTTHPGIGGVVIVQD